MAVAGLYKPGDFIAFHYTHVGKKRNRAVGDLHDPDKEVFVLNPLWQGTMHGIDLARVTPAERDVLRQIMDPKVKSGETPAKYPLVSDILNRFDPLELIGQPMVFYTRFVKPFIRYKDCYRRYFPQHMSGVRVIEQSSGGSAMPTNPNPMGQPLFKK